MEMEAFLWPRPHIRFDLSHHTCSVKHAALSDTSNCCDSRRLLTPSCDLFCSLSLVFFPLKGLGQISDSNGDRSHVLQQPTCSEG